MFHCLATVQTYSFWFNYSTLLFILFSTLVASAMPLLVAFNRSFRVHVAGHSGIYMFAIMIQYWAIWVLSQLRDCQVCCCNPFSGWSCSAGVMLSGGRKIVFSNADMRRYGLKILICRELSQYASEPGSKVVSDLSSYGIGKLTNIPTNRLTFSC